MSGDRPRLVVVGISCVGAKYLSRAARLGGFDPVVVIGDPARYQGESLARLLECTVLIADITDAASVTTVLRGHPELLTRSTIVTSPFDETFPVVDAVAADLGITGPGPVTARLANKAFVVSLVPEFSPPTRCLTLAELSGETELPGPAVLKPSLCTAGLGVRVFEERRLTREALVDAIESSGVPGARSQSWLLQQHLPGDLASVEGYFRHGELRVIGFSTRTRTGSTEMVNTFPDDEALPDAARARVVAAVTALAGRAGFTDGYLHSEFLVHGNSAALIDANMGRLSGGAMVEQIALANDLPAEQILAHALLLPLHPDRTPPAYRPTASVPTVAAYHYGLRRGGVLRSVRTPADTRCLHTRYAATGQPVPPIGATDYAWVGIFTGSPGDCAAAVAGTTIRTDDGEQPACCYPERSTT